MIRTQPGSKDSARDKGVPLPAHDALLRNTTEMLLNPPISH